ncbi:MAG: hypothetical protein ABI352_02140 [Candidatus Dormibacter sp.]
MRAGIIIGSGSASFEIMLDLVTHLPAMITPRWVGNRCHAVELSDALHALVGAVDGAATLVVRQSRAAISSSAAGRGR